MSSRHYKMVRVSLRCCKVVLTLPCCCKVVQTSPHRRKVVRTSPCHRKEVLTSRRRRKVVRTPPRYRKVVRMSPCHRKVVLTSHRHRKVVLMSRCRRKVVPTSRRRRKVVRTLLRSWRGPRSQVTPGRRTKGSLPHQLTHPQFFLILPYFLSPSKPSTSQYSRTFPGINQTLAITSATSYSWHACLISPRYRTAGPWIAHSINHMSWPHFPSARLNAYRRSSTAIPI
jgi:hypothetical protein